MPPVSRTATTAAARAPVQGVGVLNVRLTNSISGMKVQGRLTHRNLKSPTALSFSAPVVPSKGGKLTVRVGNESVEVRSTKGTMLDPRTVAAEVASKLRTQSEGKYVVELRLGAPTAKAGAQPTAELVIFDKLQTAPAQPPAVELYEKNSAALKPLKRAPTLAADATRIDIKPPDLMGVQRYLVVSGKNVYLQTSGRGPSGFTSTFSEVGKLP